MWKQLVTLFRFRIGSEPVSQPASLTLVLQRMAGKNAPGWSLESEALRVWA